MPQSHQGDEDRIQTKHLDRVELIAQSRSSARRSVNSRCGVDVLNQITWSNDSLTEFRRAWIYNHIFTTHHPTNKEPNTDSTMH